MLDANVVINAYQRHFPISQSPTVWSKLLAAAKAGWLKIPMAIMQEIDTHQNEFIDWLQLHEARQFFQLDEVPDQQLVEEVIHRGYAPDLSAREHAALGQDPILIALAASEGGRRAVVTDERSEPFSVNPENQRKRANRTIPDVCRLLNVPWESGSDFFAQRLGFTIPAK